MIYPGMTTLATAAGTFPADRLIDGVLHFEVKVPTDQWGSLAYVALGDNGVPGYWRAPAGLGLEAKSDDRGAMMRWTVDGGHTFYVLALSCSSRRVEVRLPGLALDRAPGPCIDRTFSGPWLRSGWQLAKPMVFTSGMCPLDIAVRAPRSRAGVNRGKPVALDLSYLSVRNADKDSAR